MSTSVLSTLSIANDGETPEISPIGRQYLIKIPEHVEAALKAGATDDELQSIYDIAIREREDSQLYEVLSRTLGNVRGYNLPSTTIIQLSDHATIARDTGGPGIPIVLLHALSMDGSMYRAIYPDLQRCARVIMYDIRGFGYAQDAPPVKSVSQLAEDLATLLDKLSIPVADVYGTSYGGAIAQQFAGQYPDRARSIGVLASVTQGFPAVLQRAEDAETHGMEYLIAPTLMRWLAAERIASNTWEVRFARTCVRRAKVEQWAAAWRAFAAYNATDGLKGYQGPVLAIGGKQDVSTPPDMVKKVAEVVTNGRYFEIDPGTHLMVMEQADKLVEILLEFRRKVDATS